MSDKISKPSQLKPAVLVARLEELLDLAEATGVERNKARREERRKAISPHATQFANDISHLAARAAEFDIVAHLHRRRDFSLKTFGPGLRTQGLVDHIKKELQEILADPTDHSEWIDVIILGFDRLLRTGIDPVEALDQIVAKQTKNEGRAWPDWRTADPNKAIEHDRSKDAPC